MNSLTLGAAGYILLFSSLTFFIILLKQSYRCSAKTSIYYLTVSDILSSMLTAGILLFNWFNGMLQEDTINGTREKHSSMLNYSVSSSMESDEYRQTFAQFLNHYSSASTKFNETITCNFSHVIMHYGMFLLPFVNALVSLLSFSLQANWNVQYISDKCKQLRDSSSNIQVQDTEGQIYSGTFTHSKTNLFSREELKNERVLFKEMILNVIANFFNGLKQDKLKPDDKRTSYINILSQWFVPVFITGILYFAEYYKMEQMPDPIDDTCIFTMNFPFDNHCPSSDAKNTQQYGYKNTIQILNNNMNDENLLEISHPNAKETDHVVSRIYNIMHSILNNSNSKLSETNHNSSELWNITKYLNVSEILTQNNDWNMDNIPLNDTNILEVVDEENKTVTELSHSLSQEKRISNLGSMDLLNNKLELLKNVTKEPIRITHLEPSTYSIQTIKFNNTNGNNRERTQRVHENQEDNLNKFTNGLNINDIASKYKEKCKTNDTKYNETMQTEHVIHPLDTGGAKLNSNGSTISTISDNKTYTKGMIIPSECLNNHCFVSPTFVKLHMLILIFVIYFVSIIISSILQLQARYRCKNLSLNQQKMNNMERIKKNNENSEDKIVTEKRESVINQNIRKLAWHTEENKLSNNHPENDPKDDEFITEIEFHNKGENDSISESIQINEIDVIDEADVKTMTNFNHEIENMMSLLQLLKISFLCGISLWTPLFFEVLAKIFLCMNVPNWLMNISFLSAMSFGIIRNFLNLNMIHSQKNDNDKTKKGNAVNPSS
ncbi:uncharacterized protein LOC111674073 [Orussus abietinus]|uniref:uncharacterized protein LOC111674073 n=1 Tax=Orussus abietinus TaxID=222816 RepID=UPI000C715F38|nr:uncharacterized protein LOC111674073 [Orussus abietinus]